MSLFGSLSSNTQAQGGGGFGSLNNNTQQSQPQQGVGLFGSLGQSNQPNQGQQGVSPFGTLGQSNQQNQGQQGGSLFGSLGQSTQQNQGQQGASPFGALGQSSSQQPQQQGGGLFGSLGQNNQQQSTQQSGGLFGGLGQNNQQQHGGGLFGQSTQQQPQQSSFFGSVGQSNQQNQQNQQQGGGLFGGLNTGSQNQQNQQGQLGGFNLGNSQLWQPEIPHQKNVPEQIATIVSKWDTGSSDCAFRYYFYNKVGEDRAPYFGPAPSEDPKAWEEALSKKPGPGYIPVLCTGFAQMGERIKVQQRNLATFNQKLHEINNSLEAMLSRHDLILSVRSLDAKRKHTVLKQRCLSLATKVQILRNRGYTMEQDEQELKDKLLSLEKQVCDPELSARAEEIWARMVGIRERARILKEEMGKRAKGSEETLDEESVRRAEKVLEAYGQQLQHMKKELTSIQEVFKEWEKDQQPQPGGR